jgi:hypothetical protein
MSENPFEKRDIQLHRTMQDHAQEATQPRPEMDAAAFHGLAGTIIRKIEPHTEADPAAMLVQFLIAFGNCIGRGAFFRVEETPHFANEFAAIVGQSAKARKGTGFNRIAGMIERADPNWHRDCHVNGLVSGEGIIHAVRDDMPGKKEGETVLGVTDKRLLVVEEELGGTLSAAARLENTLTATLRSAWDGKDLRTLAKNCPARATAPHISLIGHITFDELKKKLRGDSISNGFANRFRWIFSARTRMLPHGGTLRIEQLSAEIEKLRRAVERAASMAELTRDAEASEAWATAYTSWLSVERPGIVGEVTSRMEAHAVRLSLIYALLDGSPVIRIGHLNAAFAICKYAIRSAEICFAGLSADAIAIRDALEAKMPDELPRSSITKEVFKGHISAERLDAALGELERAGLATRRTEATSGPPRELWRSAK